MRRRLLASTVAVVLVALLLFAVPLGVVVTRVQRDRALETFAQQLQQVAAFLSDRAVTALGAQLILRQAHDVTGGRLILFGPGGEVIADSAPLPARPRPPARGAQEAVAAQRSGRLEAFVPVPDLPGYVLFGVRSDRDLVASNRRAWLVIVGLGSLVLAVAAGAALVQGHRLARPLEALAGAARRLADGDFTASAPRSGLPEPDQIADALDHTAGRLGSTLDRSRTAAADASHQLRTPLTALHLELEALAASGADPERVAAAMRQAERLQATVDEFLELTTLERPTLRVDLAEVVDARVAAWAPAAAARGRQVRLDVSPVPPVRVRPEAVGQALQVLLDNALQHGRGTIRVRVAPSAARDARPDARGVRLTVLDEGPGIGPHALRALEQRAGPPGHRGLALARSLVEAEGGRLVVESLSGATAASLILPSALPEADDRS